MVKRTIASGDGNVVFHDFVDPRATDYEDVGASEVIELDVLSVLMLLGDAVINEG